MKFCWAQNLDSTGHSSHACSISFVRRLSHVKFKKVLFFFRIQRELLWRFSGKIKTNSPLQRVYGTDQSESASATLKNSQILNQAKITRKFE